MDRGFEESTPAVVTGRQVRQFFHRLYVDTLVADILVWDFIVPLPPDNVGKGITLSGCLSAASVCPFIRPYRSCYYDIS